MELCRKSVNRCLRKDPTSRKLQDLQVKLGLALNNVSTKMKFPSIRMNNQANQNNLGLQWQWDSEMDQYESFKTCVGDYEHDLLSRKMKCRYNHHNSPFLTIAPLKEEMLSLVPKVSIFREALYDSEIERLKQDAHHLVRKCSTVYEIPFLK